MTGNASAAFWLVWIRMLRSHLPSILVLHPLALALNAVWDSEVLGVAGKTESFGRLWHCRRQ